MSLNHFTPRKQNTVPDCLDVLRKQNVDANFKIIRDFDPNQLSPRHAKSNVYNKSKRFSKSCFTHPRESDHLKGSSKIINNNNNNNNNHHQQQQEKHSFHNHHVSHQQSPKNYMKPTRLVNHLDLFKNSQPMTDREEVHYLPYGLKRSQGMRRKNRPNHLFPPASTHEEVSYFGKSIGYDHTTKVIRSLDSISTTKASPGEISIEEPMTHSQTHLEIKLPIFENIKQSMRHPRQKAVSLDRNLYPISTNDTKSQFGYSNRHVTLNSHVDPTDSDLIESWTNDKPANSDTKSTNLTSKHPNSWLPKVALTSNRTNCDAILSTSWNTLTDPVWKSEQDMKRKLGFTNSGFWFRERSNIKPLVTSHKHQTKTTLLNSIMKAHPLNQNNHAKYKESDNGLLNQPVTSKAPNKFGMPDTNSITTATSTATTTATMTTLMTTAIPTMATSTTTSEPKVVMPRSSRAIKVTQTLDAIDENEPVSIRSARNDHSTGGDCDKLSALSHPSIHKPSSNEKHSSNMAPVENLVHYEILPRHQTQPSNSHDNMVHRIVRRNGNSVEQHKIKSRKFITSPSDFGADFKKIDTNGFYSNQTGLSHDKTKSIKTNTNDDYLDGKGTYLKLDPISSRNETNEVQFPISPKTALCLYEKSLTAYEKVEILDYEKIWYLGSDADKIRGTFGAPSNGGYDDETGGYNKVTNDHLAYRFQALETLGKGSFGRVIRAIDHRTGSPVAIKIIRNKKRFHQQGQVEVSILEEIKKLDPHSTHNVIHIREHFGFRGHLCIVFDLMGPNLYDILRKNDFRGFTIHSIRKITIKLLECLILLRRHGIIHCDFKPENILTGLRNSSELKVIDFGSSCYSNRRIFTYIQSRFYRAPEVILGIPYGTPIDIWSLGCIIPELYTGRPLCPGENENEQLGCMMEFLGLPPDYLLEKATRRKVFFDSNGDPRHLVNSRGRHRTPGSRKLQDMIRTSDTKFIEFISQCLTWDPDLRLKPEEAMNHDWIRRGGHSVSTHSSHTMDSEFLRRDTVI